MRHYRTHENVKPYECSICQQSFGRKDLRDRHERNVHQALRPPSIVAPSDGVPVPATSPSALQQTAFSLLGPEMRRSCLDLYFNCFATSTPVIHRPTFNRDRRDPGLIRVMVAIGASYSDNADVRSIAAQIYKEEWISVRNLFVNIHVEDPRTFDILSEVVLLSMFCVGHLDEIEIPDCRILLLESIQFARRLGFGRPLISTATRAPETLHQRWLEWVKYETFKRLAICFYIVDAIVSCTFSTAALMSIYELKHNMPVDEMIWYANTAEEWQTACLSEFAHTESPLISAVQALLESHQVPSNLNELSSTLLSTFLFTSIGEFNEKKAQQLSDVGSQARYSHETAAREAQLKIAMDVLLDRARSQRLMRRSSSILWDMTSEIQQIAYLRLYLPAAQTRYGIVTSDLSMAMNEVTTEIVKEDLGVIEYRPITILLNWFIERMLSQTHLQHHGSLRTSETSVGCIALSLAMVEIWRLVRYTNLHVFQISQSPELSAARQSFLNTVRELCQAAIGVTDSSAVFIPEEEVANVLMCLCMNMFRATGMGTFQCTATGFSLLVNILRNEDTSTPVVVPRPGLGAWAMITRTL